MRYDGRRGRQKDDDWSDVFGTLVTRVVAFDHTQMQATSLKCVVNGFGQIRKSMHAGKVYYN